MKLTKTQIKVLKKCAERPASTLSENSDAVTWLWMVDLIDCVGTSIYITDAGRSYLEKIEAEEATIAMHAEARRILAGRAALKEMGE